MQTTQTENRILNIDDVKARTRYSTTSIYRLAAAGEFPKQIKLGARKVGWLASEIDAWIHERAAARNQ
ncbi:helix-turn-helix transcriptional regulator [Paraburkholderia sacchari]|uniref:helix-turn-helix transcriptional regulator n=1 Tax=Paraburkholderia sacchari TaxID=159450 RepID=UPI000543CC8D|nr:AlpA family transcriptional regulator [Paraburkholderia sacchari]NLP64302.1 AlpA family transcriptional regulator [Paraburkholderia sacchari]